MGSSQRRRVDPSTGLNLTPAAQGTRAQTRGLASGDNKDLCDRTDWHHCVRDYFAFTEAILFRQAGSCAGTSYGRCDSSWP